MSEAVQERYASACNASNLRLDSRRIGAADVLIAAGWSSRSAGAALMRLASEWDGSSRMTSASVDQMKAFSMRLARLKSLPKVRDYLVEWAKRKHIDGDVALSALLHWLQPNCDECSGRQWQIIEDTPKLSDQPCNSCLGTGLNEVPGGEDGKKVMVHLDCCVSEARSSIVRALRA